MSFFFLFWLTSANATAGSTGAVAVAVVPAPSGQEEKPGTNGDHAAADEVSWVRYVVCGKCKSTDQEEVERKRERFVYLFIYFFFLKKK